MIFFNDQEPLGLPKGSVRSIIAILVISVSFLLIWQVPDLKTELIGLIMLVVTYYFNKRENQ